MKILFINHICVIKIAPTAIGATNLIKKYQVFKNPSLNCNCSWISSFFINQPTKIATKSPPKGKSKLFPIKTIESRIVLSPRSWKSLKILKLSTLPIPRNHAKKPKMNAALFLEIIFFSEK